MAQVLVPVRAKPGAKRTAVGGSWNGDHLVVAVTARAVDGAANEAIVAAVAQALGVPRGDVALRHGARARSKVLAVAGDEQRLRQRLAELLRG